MPDAGPVDFDALDFYTDPGVAQDPYPYYEHLRARCPVVHEAHHGTYAVTGYDDAIAVLNDKAVFSSCVSAPGPFAGFPEVPAGLDDASDVIERARAEMPTGHHLFSLDPPEHTAHRALLMRLITPKRLAENEEFMWTLADRQLDELAGRRECEFVSEFATPFTVSVITDLLGVPEEHRATFRERLAENAVSGAAKQVVVDPLAFVREQFTGYIEDRRRNPRDDVLTGMATATFPDGAMPEPAVVAAHASFLYAAGGGTTARLLAASLQRFGEDPDLQEQLRADRTRIPSFIEEMLRFAGIVKSDHRLTRVPTTVAGVDIPAGRIVNVLLGAANRDPRRFERPDEFDPDRPNVRQHLAFGHGIHTCPGAPLARAEARVALERILDRMHDIRISARHHGPPGSRRFEYQASFLFRGLTDLHLEFTPAP